MDLKNPNKLLDTLSFKDLSLLSTMAQERNLSATARELGMSQSTVSYGLDKLRELFGDPLFVRRGHSWIVTRKGFQLAHRAESALQEFLLLTKEQKFEPEKSNRHFLILCQGPDMRVFDYLVPLVYKQAPKIGLEFRVSPPAEVDRQLHQSADIYCGADLGRAPGVAALSGTLSPIKLIFNSEFVTPPRTAEEMLERRFATHPAIGTPAGAKGMLDLEMERLGMPPLKYALRTTSMPRIASTLRVSDIIFSMPIESVPKSFEGLCHADLPFEVGALNYSVRWSVSKEADPALLWLKDLAKTCFETMVADSHANVSAVTKAYSG